MGCDRQGHRQVCRQGPAALVRRPGRGTARHSAAVFCPGTQQQKQQQWYGQLAGRRQWVAAACECEPVPCPEQTGLPPAETDRLSAGLLWAACYGAAPARRQQMRPTFLTVCVAGDCTQALMLGCSAPKCVVGWHGSAACSVQDRMLHALLVFSLCMVGLQLSGSLCATILSTALTRRGPPQLYISEHHRSKFD